MSELPLVSVISRHSNLVLILIGERVFAFLTLPLLTLEPWLDVWEEIIKARESKVNGVARRDTQGLWWYGICTTVQNSQHVYKTIEFHSKNSVSKVYLNEGPRRLAQMQPKHLYVRLQNAWWEFYHLMHSRTWKWCKLSMFWREKERTTTTVPF